MLEVHETSLGKIRGASPADDRYYVTVLFDISDPKKYRRIIKVLNGYTDRIQYSIFEAYLKNSQIKELIKELEGIMGGERYYNPTDKIRVYRIAGNCELTALGEYQELAPAQDLFI